MQQKLENEQEINKARESLQNIQQEIIENAQRKTKELLQRLQDDLYFDLAKIDYPQLVDAPLLIKELSLQEEMIACGFDFHAEKR